MTTKRPREPQKPVWADLARYLALALVLGVLQLQGVCDVPTTGLDAHTVGTSP